MALQERHKSFSSSKVHTTTMGVQRLMTQALDVEDKLTDLRNGMNEEEEVVHLGLGWTH